MTNVQVTTLEEAVRIAIRQAESLGTWDTEWYDYAPRGWAQRVKNSPPELQQKAYREVMLERERRALKPKLARYLAGEISGLDYFKDYGAYLRKKHAAFYAEVFRW